MSMNDDGKSHDGRNSYYGSQRRRRINGRSSGPEPRHPTKHALNPPIVTIFGSGIAGLTAAHELVERGFYVQVIEAKEDPYRPGCPIVGGMAANQPARVRANLEDLHDELIPVAADRENPKSHVARWLLRLFAFNRARWIQSEQPEKVQLFIGEKTREDEILEPLRRARRRYKNRWLWDLVIRACKIGAIAYEDRDQDGNRRGIEPEKADELYKALVKEPDVVKLAILIRRHQSGPNLPTEDELKAHEEMVRLAFQREFLCFRLLPSDGGEDALKLRDTWVKRFLELELNGCCVTETSPDQPAGIPIAISDAAPGRGVSGPVTVTPPVEYEGAWLAIDVIEQRLPGEHGYRFFPTFYHHLEDTMRRIPLTPDDPVSGRSVLDNLKPTIRQGMGFSEADIAKMMATGAERPPVDQDPDRCGSRLATGSSVVELHRTRPNSIEGFRNRTDRFVKRLGGSQRDAVFIFTRLLRFMMSSSERRKAEYQTMSWARFLEIMDVDEKLNKEVPAQNQKLSRTMIDQITSAAQALLAFSAKEADARSYGNIAVQMLLDELGDGTRVDRTLNGPTSDAWLEPWRRYLERQGVRFFQGRLNGLKFADDGTGEVVPDFTVSTDKRSFEDGREPLSHQRGPVGHQPDFYVLALDVEQSRDLVKSFVEQSGLAFERERAPDFVKLLAFCQKLDEEKALKDMTGLQFFFDAKTSIGRGHMYFPYSEWGLSSISQSEFWNLRSGFAEGFADVLSVDICTTGRPEEAHAGDGTFWGIMNGPKDAEPDEIDRRRLDVARKVWEQLRPRIDDRDKIAEPRYVHVDHNIRPDRNETKFLASLCSEGALRPGYSAKEGCVGAHEIEYSLNYDRWVMCGTFMATLTRLTTMESANESARHAVNAILDALELDTPEKIKQNIKPVGARGFLDAASEEARAATTLWIETYVNLKYNGASQYRVFDPPDIYSLEDRELDDLDFFRRVDRRLQAMGLPHLFDIIDLDRKVEHAMDGVDLYKGERSFAEILGLGMSNLDSLLIKELGIGYDERLFKKRRDEARAATADVTDKDPVKVFGDMKGLLGRFKNVLEALTYAGAV